MKLKTKKALLSTSIALSSASLIAFSNPAFSETLVIEAESFVNSGGSYADGNPSPPSPVNIYSVGGASAINWVNAGDYVDFNVNAQGGTYNVEYSVGTSVASNANIELFINQNSAWISQGTVGVPLGQWDDFQSLAHSQQVTLPAGASQIRLQGVGATWQWNMDSFSLTSIAAPTPTPVTPTPTPTPVTPTPTATDAVLVEGEDFVDTGGPNGGFTTRTFWGTTTFADRVLTGDWAEYEVFFPASGIYDLTFIASTNRTSDSGVNVYIDGQLVASGDVHANNLNQFVEFAIGSDISVTEGIHTVRLEPTASQLQWNWFLDSFSFEPTGSTVPVTPTPTPTPTPVTPTPTPTPVTPTPTPTPVTPTPTPTPVTPTPTPTPVTPTPTPTPGDDSFFHNGNGLLWSRVDGATNFAGNAGYVANPDNYLVTTDLLETEDAIRGNSTEVFRGEIYDADGNISFYENIDDSVRLYIDGNLVLSDDSWENATQTANLQVSPGWVSFELRLGNADGGSGAVSDPGFGIDVSGGTNFVHPSALSQNIFRSSGQVIRDPILPPPGGIVIELEDFDDTGTVGRVASDPNDGFVADAGATTVSFVTNGDWGDYRNVFLEAGTYRSFINVSTGSDGSYGARIDLDGWPVSWGYFDHTGGWDVPEEVELYGGDFVVETSGNYTLRVQAIGGSDWQWGGDNIRLAKVSDDAVRPSAIYNPNEHTVAEVEGPVSGLPFLKAPVQVPVSNRLLKSDVWYTYPQNRDFYVDTAGEYADFGATGSFWGHPPEENFYDEATIVDWTQLVQNYQDEGIEYTARGEFDWGFRWVTEYLTNPEPHYVKTLDGRNVRMTFMGYLSHDGYNNNWLSNHSPAFVPHMKSQVDQILRANPDKLMFDTQTSSTRSTDMRTFGGDFNDYAMQNFNVWLSKKYSGGELSALGINDINTFNYRDFLLAQGVTHTSFSNAADRIEGNVPLLEDFIYFNRDVWNQKFAEVLEYIRDQRPGIEIGASTHLFESRGYIFNENITFLSGELNLGARTTIAELPTNILVHLKGAEAVDKTLAYFPYPWEFAELRDQNAPRFGRGWVAQSYAYGGLFSIPANVWVGGSTGENTWSPGADNYRDIYQFVRAQENLLDGYKSYSKVGLVHAMYSSMKAGFIDGGNQIQSSVRLLTEDNINFDLLVFGDEGYPVVPRAGDFDQFDHIVYDGDLQYLTAAQEAVLNQQGSKVRHIGQIGTIDGLAIDVSINGSVSNETVSAVSRVHETNANAPYVVHLINRPFAGGVTPTLNGVDVTIPQGYFPEGVTTATLHLPGGTSTNLAVSTNGNGDTVMTVSDLEVWGILELGH